MKYTCTPRHTNNEGIILNQAIKTFFAHFHTQANDIPDFPCICIGRLSNLWMYIPRTIIPGMILELMQMIPKGWNACFAQQLLRIPPLKQGFKSNTYILQAAWFDRSLIIVLTDVKDLIAAERKYLRRNLEKACYICNDGDIMMPWMGQELKGFAEKGHIFELDKAWFRYRELAG